MTVDEARRYYRTDLSESGIDRCVDCVHRVPTQQWDGWECQLLGMGLYRARESRCPKWASKGVRWRGSDETS